jgi:hypothetical protein
MPSVRSYANAFPGVPYPSHTSTTTTKPQNYRYPGAVQPISTKPTVLPYTIAFPGAPFPSHTSTTTTKPQNFMYPGAAQPFGSAAAVPTLAIPRRVFLRR